MGSVNATPLLLGSPLTRDKGNIVEVKTADDEVEIGIGHIDS